MIASHTREIQWRGKPATLTVFRNDGFCWGRLMVIGGPEYDVDANQDLYDEEDEWALDVFEEAAKEDSNLTDAVSWL